MYHCHETGVYWDRYKNRFIIDRRGNLRSFEYPQVADVFVYCAKHYGAVLAEEVADNLEAKLKTTLGKFVKDSATSEAKDTIRDYLLGKIGVPQVPGPIGLAQKVIDAAAVALGEAYLQTKVANNKAIKAYWADITPTYSVDTYCKWVIYSWVQDPENGPYYTVYAPNLRAPNLRAH